jgi:hypothetical protein
MPFEDNFSETEDGETSIGSDELLADDALRLPDAASPLVRLHAVRAWLGRRQRETSIEIGTSALALQEAMEQGTGYLRRREQQRMEELRHSHEMAFQAAQLRLQAFEEAEELLNEYVTHTTTGNRTLVEYYLALEDLLEELHSEVEQDAAVFPRYQTLQEVQQRVEHVGIPQEED